MTGAGAPRATFGLGFRGGHSITHSIARGVTDPGIGCTDWLGLFLSLRTAKTEHIAVVVFDLECPKAFFRIGDGTVEFHAFLLVFFGQRVGIRCVDVSVPSRPGVALMVWLYPGWPPVQ